MTKIEWTNKTWNPIVGCSKVSPGCANCYAERMAVRLQAMDKPGYHEVVNERGHWTGNVNLRYDILDAPLRWRKPAMVFVNSMSDLFHPAVPFEFIDRIFAVMGRSQQHTFQILTKRPELMLQYLQSDPYRRILDEANDLDAKFWIPAANLGTGISDPARMPLPNVWLGVSVESQAAADVRIPLLIRTPAAVRFVSAEPLLGPLDLLRWTSHNLHSIRCNGGLTFHELGKGETFTKCTCHLNWVIAGGESGPSARPMHPDWARALRDQCQEAHVPFFFKQHGEWLHRSQISRDLQGDLAMMNVFGHGFKYHTWSDGTDSVRLGKKQAGRTLDGRTWDQFPEVCNA